MFEPVGIAFLVMALRAVDVSLGTLKTVFVIEGRKGLAPVLSFFEATIFVIAASLVFRDLGNPFTIVGFGAGFALGTAFGMLIAERLGLGSVTVRFTMSGDSWDLEQALRAASFRLTTFAGGGRDGPVSVVQLNVRKRTVSRVVSVARPWLHRCFVTVGDEPLQSTNSPAVLQTLRRVTLPVWPRHAPRLTEEAAVNRAELVTAVDPHTTPATEAQDIDLAPQAS